MPETLGCRRAQTPGRQRCTGLPMRGSSRLPRCFWMTRGVSGLPAVAVALLSLPGCCWWIDAAADAADDAAIAPVLLLLFLLLLLLLLLIFLLCSCSCYAPADRAGPVLLLLLLLLLRMLSSCIPRLIASLLLQTPTTRRRTTPAKMRCGPRRPLTFKTFGRPGICRCNDNCVYALSCQPSLGSTETLLDCGLDLFLGLR